MRLLRTRSVDTMAWRHRGLLLVSKEEHDVCGGDECNFVRKKKARFARPAMLANLWDTSSTSHRAQVDNLNYQQDPFIQSADTKRIVFFSRNINKVNIIK